MAIAIIALIGSACGGDGESGDEEAIRQAVEDSYAALAARDIEVYLSLVTEAHLEDVYLFPVTKEEIQEDYEAGNVDVNTPTAEVGKLTDIEVSGDTATAELWERQASSVEPWTLHLVKNGDQWQLDSVEPMKVDTPDGATDVNVETVDHRYTLSEDVYPAGDVVFQVENAGTQPHNLEVVKLPEGVTATEASREGDPTTLGAEWTGLFAAIPSLGEGTWILEDLQPGRYGYWCWVDDLGTPHAYEGMYGEFTVE
jgi:ketosteroid isomerase-like protein